MNDRYHFISTYPQNYPSASRWSCTSSGVCVENNYSGEYTNLNSCINACSNNSCSCSTCKPYVPPVYTPPPPYIPPYMPYMPYTQPYYQQPLVYPVFQPYPVYTYYPQSLLYYNSDRKYE